jgi:hypothetical protein
VSESAPQREPPRRPDRFSDPSPFILSHEEWEEIRRENRAIKAGADRRELDQRYHQSSRKTT